MPAYEGFKVRLFRVDAHGRTVLAPSYGNGPVLLIRNDAEAGEVARFIYNSRWMAVIGGIVCLLASAWRPWMLAGVLLVPIAISVMTRRRLGRLERTGENASDLPPIDRTARAARYNEALGRRYFWNQIAAGVVIGLMMIGGVYGASRVSPSTGAMGTGARISSIVIVLLCAALVIESARRLRALGRIPD